VGREFLRANLRIGFVKDVLTVQATNARSLHANQPLGSGADDEKGAAKRSPFLCKWLSVPCRPAVKKLRADLKPPNLHLKLTVGYGELSESIDSSLRTGARAPRTDACEI
jgi:hypothetical protein